LHTDSWDRLEEISAPALVIVGAWDVHEFQVAADALATRIPRARKLTIEDAGHMSNMEQPAAFNRALLEFWASRP